MFLTGLYAYKIKKALKFGKILDFCTLIQRRKNCEKELALNKILCDDMYMKVVEVIKEENGNRVRIADLQHTRKAIEYALQMRQMPYYFRMDKLLKAGKISPKIIRNLTEVLVKFHYTTPTSDRIKNFGQPKFMRKKIAENFQTLGKATQTDNKYEKKLTSFVRENNVLFYNRIAEGKIRDIHGDLYLKNIFIVKKALFT